MNPRWFLMLAGSVMVLVAAIAITSPSAKPAAPVPLATAPAIYGPRPPASSMVIVGSRGRAAANTNGVQVQDLLHVKI